MKLNRDKANMALNYAPYLVGGSYVTNPETANDIDLVVHEHHEAPVLETLAVHGFFRLTKDNEKYDEIDNKRIISIYEGEIEGTKYNVIVVGACFWPAYVSAINEMTKWPDLYQTREKRVALHKQACKTIWNMLGDALD